MYNASFIQRGNHVVDGIAYQDGPSDISKEQYHLLKVILEILKKAFVDNRDQLAAIIHFEQSHPLSFLQ